MIALALWTVVIGLPIAIGIEAAWAHRRLPLFQFDIAHDHPSRDSDRLRGVSSNHNEGITQ